MRVEGGEVFSIQYCVGREGFCSWVGFLMAQAGMNIRAELANWFHGQRGVGSVCNREMRGIRERVNHGWTRMKRRGLAECPILSPPRLSEPDWRLRQMSGIAARLRSELRRGASRVSWIFYPSTCEGGLARPSRWGG